MQELIDAVCKEQLTECARANYKNVPGSLRLIIYYKVAEDELT